MTASVLLLVGAVACEGHKLRLRNDNDFYAVSGTDRYYTQGLAVEWLLSEDSAREMFSSVLDALPAVGEVEHPSATFVSGQKIYTPQFTLTPELQLDDRPYAGWLYGGVRLQNAGVGSSRSRGDRLDTWELTLGVIGPSSLAEKAQARLHEIYGIAPPLGWDHQLRDEPGVELRYEHTQRVWYRELDWPRSFQVDLLADAGGSLGNVLTGAHLGARLRFGGLRRDFDTVSFGPVASPVDDGVGEILPFFGFVGVKGRAVGYTVFLDGNTFERSHRVDRDPWLIECVAGFVVPLPSVRIGFSVTVTSPEFATTNSWHRYGTLQMEFSF